MPTCFLKRVLPFALTLLLGLMLGKFLGAGSSRPSTVATQHRLISAGESVTRLRGSTGVESGESRVLASREVDHKARVIERGEPAYTDEARKNMVTGTVVLRGVFSADGQVTNLRVINGLPYGLTESAIEAARGIRFSPAIKDGRAISQYIQIEYNFNLY